MRIGSLFSGYGGLDLAVRDVLGGDVAWHVEYDRAPSRILAHHYPDVPNHGDVTRVDFTHIEPVDVITGGYPCQPFSHAGLRKGTNDERHLWPHVLRAIREMGPRLAILENVRGHLSLGFADVLADLADIGWAAEWCIIRASDAGAPHQRARLFIVAYPADPCGQRHGAGKNAGRVGRMDCQDAGRPWEWQRARKVIGDRGSAPTSYPDVAGRQARSNTGQDSERPRAQPLGRATTGGWGHYEPAIRRWEAVLGRPAPPATDSRARLSPAFVEWMMGLPAGWVTDGSLGLGRTAQLKALGNGVVPQQAALALDCLLPRVTPALAEVAS